MKKLLLAVLLAFSLSGCMDEPDKTPHIFPSDVMICAGTATTPQGKQNLSFSTSKFTFVSMSDSFMNYVNDSAELSIKRQPRSEDRFYGIFTIKYNDGSTMVDADLICAKKEVLDSNK